MNNYMKNRIFDIIVESNLVEIEMKKKCYEYDDYEDWVINQVERISIEIVKVVENEIKNGDIE